ncbi:MAG TPA: heparan N-sulfatase, partial [Planctomycetaceae bacterium]|nr:heparan N-sulfatase [Planctomycetaceae bacterium]
MTRKWTCLTVLGLALGVATLPLGPSGASDADERPNILFAIADDWSWPHASAYGDPVVKTPTFDRLAREGVLFHHAYVSSPSCTPSRGAVLTGQWHWRLEQAGNLWSVFPDKFRTYPEILKQHGYFIGVSGKGWGP